MEDDPLLDLPELPAHQLFSRSGTDEPQTKETKGNKGLGQSGQGSGKPPAKPPKIRNLRVLLFAWWGLGLQIKLIIGLIGPSGIRSDEPWVGLELGHDW